VHRKNGTGATALEQSERYLLEACVGAGRTLVGGVEVEVDRPIQSSNVLTGHFWQYAYAGIPTTKEPPTAR